MSLHDETKKAKCLTLTKFGYMISFKRGIKKGIFLIGFYTWRSWRRIHRERKSVLQIVVDTTMIVRLVHGN